MSLWNFDSLSRFLMVLALFVVFILVLLFKIHSFFTNLKLEAIIDFSAIEKTPQNDWAFGNINKAFVQDIVVGPNFWELVSEVKFSLVSSKFEMIINNFSCNLLHTLSGHVTLLVVRGRDKQLQPRPDARAPLPPPALPAARRAPPRGGHASAHLRAALS